MAVLDKIRKRTTVLIVIIGLALFSFVISGIFTQTGADGPGAVAEVNGTEISLDEFRQKMEAAAQRAGGQASSAQIAEQVWNAELRKVLMEEAFDDLGITIEGDQIIDFLATVPAYAQAPEFQADGVFDPSVFVAAVAQWKANDPARYQMWLQDELAISLSAKEQSYNSLLAGSIYTTVSDAQAAHQKANAQVDLSFVQLPYTLIPDAEAEVSVDEIKAYMKKFPKRFEQKEARTLRAVYIQELPSAADEAVVEQEMSALVEGFNSAEDLGAFLAANSEQALDTAYYSKDNLNTSFGNQIIATGVGQTFGPYRENGQLKYSKLLGVKPNGWARASHVLIGWSGAERIRPDVTRNQEEARVRALEVLAKAQAPGADFAALAREFSDGPTAQNGGDLGYFGPGEMTPKFNDFVFGKSVGAIEMIETEFGYHVVKVEEKQPSYQVANLTKYIAPSEQTINELFTKAAAFEMEATKDPLKFEEVAKAQNLSVFPINKLSSMDENLPGIGLQRGIVQWSFLPETKVGEIKKFNVANGYVIVQLVTKLNKGMMDAADAALTVIPVLRNEKKAAALKAQYQGLTLEAAAAKAGVAVQQATAMTAQSPVLPGAGREPFVVGYAFSLEGGATSAPLKGNSGVFLVQVNQKRSPEALADYKVLARSQNAGQINLAPYRAYSARVNAAKIEDNRFLFY